MVPRASRFHIYTLYWFSLNVHLKGYYISGYKFHALWVVSVRNLTLYRKYYIPYGLCVYCNSWTGYLGYWLIIREGRWGRGVILKAREGITVILILGLQELSRYPNVYCKASGMFLTDPKWDQKSVDMVVKPLFEMFGFNRSKIIKKVITDYVFSLYRTVFASNFPVDKVNGTFPQLIDALRDTLKPFSLQEQEKFFSDNSKRFYRL